MTLSQKKDPVRISVRDANQGFSKLIARVEQGERFVVTKNNKEVARIEPAAPSAEDEAQAQRRAAAWARLQKMMRAGYTSKDGWTFKGKRDELHDRSV